MNDFGNIKHRSDIDAYIMDNGFMIPSPNDETVPSEIHAQFDALWRELDAYAKANPDKVSEELPEVPSEPTLEELKAAKLAEINAAYDSAVSALVAGYPSNELLTFDKQETEARAWTADNSADTPLVDALALGRGMDKTELVSRILVKAESLAVATGYLTGLRQRYEDSLELAQSAQDVAAIVVKYSLSDEGATA